MDKDPPEGVEPNEVLEGEVEPLRPGSQAWLRAQPHTEVEGRRLPVVHRLDLVLGSLVETEDGRCQYVRPEKGRCGAPRLLGYGICLVHAGGGSDLQEIGRKGAATQARLKVSRQMLGVGTVRSADPRQLSRVRAQARAEEIAEALLAPLDDADLGAMTKQRSAVTILDSLFPQETVQLSVEIPADAAGVQALSWAEMQALAAQLLGDTSETEALEPA